jgi:hypothetical protein
MEQVGRDGVVADLREAARDVLDVVVDAEASWMTTTAPRASPSGLAL